MSARNLALLLPLAVAATLACSKTQDTAPERRIFGEPPIIQSVNPNFLVANEQVECDFTAVAFGLFCESGMPDLELQAGTGWTLVEDPVLNKQVVVHSETPTSVPGVFINGNYSKFTFEVRAVDPNSTPGNNNILLVSSSFVTPESKVETTLVLFDDGSESNFSILQRAPGVEEDCAADACFCTQATYNVTSGDDAKGNDLYTREFIVLNRTAPNFLTDCIMRELGVVGASAKPRSRFEFQIEAVDRQGNLTVWPNKLVAETGDGRFACEGDSCACCMMHYQSNLTELCTCKDEPGAIVPSQFPNGFCKDYLSIPIPGPGC